MLVALLGLPAWAAQESGAQAAGEPESVAPEGGIVEQSAAWATWWDAQETWQRWLYALGLVAVILVVLQLRYRWVEKTNEAVPRWWKTSKVFVVEVKGEWGKVTKPPRTEVIQTTIVVVVVSVIFALYLWISDQIILKAYQWTFETLGL